MALGLKLLPGRSFEITTESGEVYNGKFGTYSTDLFTSKKGVKLSELSDVFSNLTMTDAIDFVLCALEYGGRKEKKPIMGKMELCDFIDQYAADNGLGEGMDVLSLMINHASSSYQKKSQTEDEVSSGQTS
jgi:hypothetical protein